MTDLRTGLLAAALLFATFGADAHARPAAPAAAPAPAPAPRPYKGEALARLVSSSDGILDLEVVTARRAFFEASRQDADMAAAERQYPGLVDAIWKALEPELRRASAEDSPKLAKRLAAIYDSNLTASEQDALLVFYSSPTGQKMIHDLYAGVDGTPVVVAAMRNPDAPVSAEAFAALNESGKRSAVRALDASDQPALAALGRSLDLDKLGAIGEQVQRTTMEWVNEPDPEGDARMEKIVEAAVKRHIAGAGKRR